MEVKVILGFPVGITEEQTRGENPVWEPFLSLSWDVEVFLGVSNFQTDLTEGVLSFSKVSESLVR